MGAMTPIVALALLAATPSSGQSAIDPVAGWRPIVAAASRRFGLPVDWIERVIRAESGGRTTLLGRPIRSKAGAIGLMQIMPETWASLRARYRLGPDPDEPRDNIIAGTAFLRMMYDRFGYPGLFAAYNAGPSRYAASLAGRKPLPAETIAYLDGLTGARSTRGGTVAPLPRASLFALDHDVADAGRTSTDTVPANGLFAIRKAVP